MISGTTIISGGKFVVDNAKKVPWIKLAEIAIALGPILFPPKDNPKPVKVSN